MADKNKRLSTNVPGTFYVDSTCINCDTCRQLAPASFVESDDFSSVYRQPERNQELLAAYQALIACPVGSIGTMQNDKDKLQEAISSFPLELDTRPGEKAAVLAGAGFGKKEAVSAASGRGRVP
jgi:ferredoxin